MIYSELLHENEAHSRIHNAPGLFGVSKQLHNEASSYWYQHNVIAIDSLSESSEGATILPPIPDQYLPYIRRFTLHLWTGQADMSTVERAAKLVASLSNIGAQFDEVTFIISTHLSNLLISRVDDPVLSTDHPIARSLHQVLSANVAKKVWVQLNGAKFATGVTRGLIQQFGSTLSFVDSKGQKVEPSLLEKPLIGRYLSSHLTALDIGEELASCSFPLGQSTGSTSSLPASFSTAFSELDSFSVTEYSLNGEDKMDALNLKQPAGEANGTEPFFHQDDIEEWESATSDFHYDGADHIMDMDDLYVNDDGMDDDDEEEEVNGGGDNEEDVLATLEPVPQDEFEDIIDNLKQVAHHRANEEDITYLANYAPDLLLARHQLAHLI